MMSIVAIQDSSVAALGAFLLLPGPLAMAPKAMAKGTWFMEKQDSDVAVFRLVKSAPPGALALEDQQLASLRRPDPESILTQLASGKFPKNPRRPMPTKAQLQSQLYNIQVRNRQAKGGDGEWSLKSDADMKA